MGLKFPLPSFLESGGSRVKSGGNSFDASCRLHPVDSITLRVFSTFCPEGGGRTAIRRGMIASRAHQIIGVPGEESWNLEESHVSFLFLQIETQGSQGKTSSVSLGNITDW